MHSSFTRKACRFTFVLGLFLLPPASVTLAGTTRLASIGLDGSAANGASSFRPGAVSSADGRYIVFYSQASNLVPGDSNGTWDVFVRDVVSGHTTRASVASDGTQGVGDGTVEAVTITADGRYVAFDSRFSNLVPGDTNGAPDVFRHDMVTGETIRVSVATGGGQANAGTWGAGSFWPSMSSDGRCIAFSSHSTDLVPGDTNGEADVFLHDCLTGETERVSLSSAGQQGNLASTESAITADGRLVAFSSWATTLVPGDLNGFKDVFIRDRQLQATTRISVSSAGAEGNSDSTWPQISADGAIVTFDSQASNLVAGDVNGTHDTFYRNRTTGVIDLAGVSSAGIQGNDMTSCGTVSSNGRFVAFVSNASNLVPDDQNTCWTMTSPGRCPDAFVHDLWTGLTRRISLATDGSEGNSSTGSVALSANAEVAVFNSYASNFASGDTNGMADVFVRDLTDAPTDSTGACCAPVGTCAVTVQAACAAGSTWQGAGTNCAPNPCVATGACCAPVGSCTVTTQPACAAGSVWQGAGTACTPDPCDATPVLLESWTASSLAAGLQIRWEVPLGTTGAAYRAWRDPAAGPHDATPTPDAVMVSSAWISASAEGIVEITDPGVPRGATIRYFLERSTTGSRSEFLGPVEARWDPPTLAWSAGPTPFRDTVRLTPPRTGPVCAEIFDPAGRLVRTLVRADGNAPLEWDGCDDAGRDVPTGIYIVRVGSTAGEAVARLVKIR
jgi:hypothetical protein